MKSKIKDITLFILEYGIAAGIIYWLYKNDTLKISALGSMTATLLINCMVMVFILVALSSVRLRILFIEKNINIGVRDCFVFNCIGILYSLVLPGGVSGDAAKAYYLLKKNKCSKSALFGCLIMDRIIGLISLVAMGLISIFILMQDVPGLSDYFYTFLIIFIAVSGTLYFMLRHDAIIKENMTNNVFSKLYTAIYNLYSRLKFSHFSFRKILQASLISLMIHGLTISVIYLSAVNNNSGLDFLSVMSVSPFGLMANAIPITPGGLGVGEQSFEYLFGLVGGESGAVSFLIARIFLYSPALIGVVFIFTGIIRSHKIN